MKGQVQGLLPQLALPQGAVEAFCLRHRVKRLSLFGSILTDRFRPDSDIDVLVKSVPGRVPGYFDLVGMEVELGEILGRNVDLRTSSELSPYFRDQVVASAAVQNER